MRPLRFFTFVLFNFFYRDGNNDRTEPYTPTLGTILLLEFFTALVGLDLLNLFVDFDIYKTLRSSLGERGFPIAFFALLGPANYYYFIKKKRFDHYYNEFKNAEMNTLKNRKIAYICLALYAPICIALIVLIRNFS